LERFFNSRLLVFSLPLGLFAVAGSPLTIDITAALRHVPAFKYKVVLTIMSIKRWEKL
jgi:hypothetical protein